MGHLDQRRLDGGGLEGVELLLERQLGGEAVLDLTLHEEEGGDEVGGVGPRVGSGSSAAWGAAVWPETIGDSDSTAGSGMTTASGLERRGGGGRSGRGRGKLHRGGSSASTVSASKGWKGSGKRSMPCTSAAGVEAANISGGRRRTISSSGRTMRPSGSRSRTVASFTARA